MNSGEFELRTKKAVTSTRFSKCIFQKSLKDTPTECKFHLYDPTKHSQPALVNTTPARFICERYEHLDLAL